jgi:hypothetical protein
MSAEKPTPERIVVDSPKTEIADEPKHAAGQSRAWRVAAATCAPRHGQRTPIHPATVIVAITHEPRKQLVGARSEDGFQVGVASAHPADEVDGCPLRRGRSDQESLPSPAADQFFSMTGDQRASLSSRRRIRDPARA